MSRKITLQKFDGEGGTLTFGQGERVRYSRQGYSHVPAGALGTVQTVWVEATPWPYEPTVMVIVKWDKLKDVTYHFAGYLEVVE